MEATDNQTIQKMLTLSLKNKKQMPKLPFMELLLENLVGI
jgi:hypothetical protein